MAEISTAQAATMKLLDEIAALRADVDALKADMFAAENTIDLIEDWIACAEPHKGVMEIIGKWRKGRESRAALEGGQHD